jgi:FSR family fosmidomycin resistance protein-like MFS transporter
MGTEKMKPQALATQAAVQFGVTYSVLYMISSMHLLNDTMQSVVPALFPIVQDSLGLSYTQIGWMSFVMSMTSSILQPFIGAYLDKHPSPLMLTIGMATSIVGIIGLAFTTNFWLMLGMIVFIGIGSALFHPEGSRVVRYASGNKRSLAQSIFQVGGNFGQALAPVITMLILVPFGQRGVLWIVVIGLIAILVSLRIAPWYRQQLLADGYTLRRSGKHAETQDSKPGGDSKPMVRKPMPLLAKPLVTTLRALIMALTLLMVSVFARSFYHTALATYYQFYLMEFHGFTQIEAQIPLFVYMLAAVVGTFLGGMLADRIGQKRMMMLSLFGAVPFALLLAIIPANVVLIYIVIFITGVILDMGFSVGVVYGQLLFPTRVGMASGMITGLGFGMGAIGSVVLGALGDTYGLDNVLLWCSFLPLVGALMTLGLPDERWR